MELPERRQWLGVLLGTLGMLAIVGALAAGVAIGTGVQATGYTHSVTGVDDGRCAADADPSSYDYDALSPAGKDVIDRAVDAPGTVVRTSEPVAAFEYGTPTDPVGPQYVEVDGDCYELTARASGFVNTSLLIKVSVLAGLAFVAGVGVLGVGVGWVIYRRNA